MKKKIETKKYSLVLKNISYLRNIRLVPVTNTAPSFYNIKKTKQKIPHILKHKDTTLSHFKKAKIYTFSRSVFKIIK